MRLPGSSTAVPREREIGAGVIVVHPGLGRRRVLERVGAPGIGGHGWRNNGLRRFAFPTKSKSCPGGIKRTVVSIGQDLDLFRAVRCEQVVDAGKNLVSNQRDGDARSLSMPGTQRHTAAPRRISRKGSYETYLSCDGILSTVIVTVRSPRPALTITGRSLGSEPVERIVGQISDPTTGSSPRSRFGCGQPEQLRRRGERWGCAPPPSSSAAAAGRRNRRLECHQAG